MIDRLDSRCARPRCRGLAVCAVLVFSQASNAQDESVALGPAATDPDWHIPVRANPVMVEPQHKAHAALRTAFNRYGAVAEQGGWDTIGAGPDLRIGQRDARVRIIRARLRATGDFTAQVEADPLFFDTGMHEAVRRFQRRHRLLADGVVGDRTREAMNVPVEDRLVQIAVALERWNWMPEPLADDHVWINVPESKLTFVVDGEEVLSMPVVVGHPHRPTPSFKSRLRQLVFNPPWYVPHTIAVEDLLPRQRRDPDFLLRSGIRVYRDWGDDATRVPVEMIDWSQVDAGDFPYQLVQEPGPANSLGRVKLVMDNPFDIFLHDSPAWRLFYLSARTLSSGCVRLQDAPALVHALMSRDQGWTAADLAERLVPGPTDFVDLLEPVDVYVVYFTSWVDDDQQLYFARDVYQRDKMIARELARAQLTELLQHVERGASGDLLALGEEPPGS